jgi:diguanylate cyclase (GGDEF)-like protein
MFALIAHLFYLFFYFFEKNIFYVTINSISISLYFIAIELNRRGRYRAGADILSVELICYAIVSSCVSGWSVGTQWFMTLVVMAHYLFLKSSTIKKIFYSVATVAAINFIFFWQMLVGPLKVGTNQDFLAFINANIFLLAILLILNIVSISDILLKESYQTALDTAKFETYIDPLTRISNRRYLDKIKPELEREASEGRKIAIALLDIDKFKDINDNYGHAFGDYALISVADKMKEIFRSEDSFIRYGGEEFIIIIRDASEEKASSAMERLRCAIISQAIEKDGNSAYITFTCGISGFKRTLEETIEEADKRMYFGKENGRDRIVCSTNYVREEPNG